MNARAVRILNGIALTAFLVAMVAVAVGALTHDQRYAPPVFACAIGVAMLVMAIQPFYAGEIRFKGGRVYTRRQDPRKFYWVAGTMLVAIVLILVLGVPLSFLRS